MVMTVRGRLTRWGVLVPVVGLVAFALFSSSSLSAKGADLRSTTANLPDLIRKQTRANQLRAAELDATQAQVDALEKSSAPFDQALKRLQTKADALAVTVGRTPVQGPGIMVLLRGSP